MSKKLIFNEVTKIIEVIEEDIPIENPKSKKDTVNFIISILSFIMSIGALGISYSQKNINEKQVDISERNFNLEKKPVFECYIEKEELYNDEDYWAHYNAWLFENNIKIFDEWQREKFPQDNIPYIDRNESRVFWDAYDTNNYTILNELTNGAFTNLQNEYSDYLRSKNYIRYDEWKEYYYIYEKDYITLKNTGGYITNARLTIYTYISYYIKIGDDISYRFAIDTNKTILSECWNGEYFTNSTYDSGNNAFYIEYTQDIQLFEDEYLQLDSLSDFILGDDMLNTIGFDADNIDVIFASTCPVYLAIEYLDIEQKEQTDWYKYDIKSNTLSNVKTYNSNVQVPDFMKDGFSDDYYEAETLRIAEILGYQNAQWRSFFTYENYSYIENAKQKIIMDLKELVDGM